MTRRAAGFAAFLATGLLAAPVLAPAAASDPAAEITPVSADDIERLDPLVVPQDTRAPKGDRPAKLKDGASLFISFDADHDGHVIAEEVENGILAAFTAADADAGGYVSVLEQQDWARSLRPIDTSLANPVRFDPNLDRRISFEEFRAVIQKLASEYADDESGHVIIAKLTKRPEKPELKERPAQELEGLPPRAGRG